MPGLNLATSPKPSYDVQISKSTKDFPQNALAVLEANAVKANTILPTFLKRRDEEQKGIVSNEYLWLVCYDSRTEPQYIVSCTKGMMGAYPIFIFTTKASQDLKDDEVDCAMQAICEAFDTCISRRRVYSVFAVDRVAERFAATWSQWTNIEAYSTPYYDSTISFLSKRNFVLPRQKTLLTDIQYDLCPATQEDIPAIGKLCEMFAAESEPFVLTPKQGRLEAELLVASGLVWVHRIQRGEGPKEIASIVAYTRNCNKVATITKVYTNPQWRRLGCAERLVRLVCKNLLYSTDPKEQIALFVGNTNPAAKVYKRVGFVGLDKEKPAVPGAERYLEIGFDRRITQERIDILLEWCRDQGIAIDPHLKLLPDSNDDIGVFTGDLEHDIPANETVVKIPKSAVLSARSCSLSEFITPAFVGSEAQLVSSLALYSELILGPRSNWYGYLQSLPEKIDLPLCWELWVSNPDSRPDLDLEDVGDMEDALQWLGGTEADKILTQNNCLSSEDLQKYFDSVVQPLLSAHSGEGSDHIGFSGFLRAYCLVSSRAFMVDTFHGLAMVPVADAFNHVQENHVHLESEYDVCPECGSVDECPHDVSEEDRQQQRTERKLDAIDPGYEMVANAPIPPLSEVYNTYGETLSNAELLCQHGFVLEANGNDTLTWTVEEILDTLECTTEPLRSTVLRTWGGYRDDPEFMDGFDDSSRLLSLSASSKETAFFINADGQVSVQLWVLLLTISGLQTKQVASLLDEAESRHALQSLHGLHIALENQVDDLDDDEDTFGYQMLGQLLSSIEGGYIDVLEHAYTLLVTVCRTRMANTGRRGHGGIEDLADRLDSPDIRKKRTRHSLLLALNENLILSSCEASWKDLVEVLGHAQPAR
ncbi:hypothetical protein EST38_g3487 [Candolleomyces aberdarensis]|uniref:N-acetyltransferase domain-containing protein n=1 Tax=Candolleomyces aberdarensis TaxID=2316362 RepID=A0A4Q2DTF5_9AGAR|nr:hypothetical protein EST38_g3487 [Candolleomyces aberdarensis]